MIFYDFDKSFKMFSMYTYSIFPHRNSSSALSHSALKYRTQNLYKVVVA